MVEDFGDDRAQEWQPVQGAARPWLTIGLSQISHKAHGGAHCMPIPSIPLVAPTLPGARSQDIVAQPGPLAAEPTAPFWLRLLNGVSLWLNRLFLGLVMALIGFTLWHWWQG
ncbi:hypothetical protein CE139_03520 [Pseudomonas oryzihabitans]|uniref:Uncharacterized protein n=1 Tax=Pseudomonas oryzihabitans TaxID=47885 RepID=A0A2Z5A4G3_9PSED|nr:hypothetical protein CE139_03520 [Pseudomonas oryzihabitans]